MITETIALKAIGKSGVELTAYEMIALIDAFVAVSGEALDNASTVTAIKAARAATGCTLRDAKHAVDDLREKVAERRAIPV